MLDYMCVINFLLLLLLLLLLIIIIIATETNSDTIPVGNLLTAASNNLQV